MEFRKATQADLDYVKSNPFEGAIKDYPYLAVPNENTYTGIHKSAILGIFGVQIKREGFGLFG